MTYSQIVFDNYESNIKRLDKVYFLNQVSSQQLSINDLLKIKKPINFMVILENHK